MSTDFLPDSSGGTVTTNHTHDMVRVENEQDGTAWNTCRTCPHRTDAEPWAPPSYTEDELNEIKARAAAAGQES